MTTAWWLRSRRSRGAVEKAATDAERGIRFYDRSICIGLSARECSYSIDCFGNHDSLIVDQTSVRRLVLAHCRHVLPEGDFVEVLVRPAEIGHQLFDGVDARQAATQGNQRNPGGCCKGGNDIRFLTGRVD